MGPPARAASTRAHLSSDRAFVVQLQDGRGRRLAGRVEHLVSGEAHRFASVEDLVAFMLRAPGARPTNPSHLRSDPAGG